MLKEYGFRILGVDSEALEDTDAVDHSPPLVILLGAGGKGLRQLTCENSNHLV